MLVTRTDKIHLEEYLERIGFHASYEKPDLATLKSIHKHHVMAIPFENLSIHCGEKIIMKLDLIFNKLVRDNRGGLCWENNFLFAWVLKEMGYNPTMLGARVFNRINNDYNPIESHLIIKVNIDGKEYIADVSFGVSYQILEPLELVSGKDQHQAPGVFRLIEKCEIWVLEKTSRKPEVLNPDFSNTQLVEKKQTNPIYCFSLVPRDVDHFLDTVDKYQTDPSSLFTNKSICSLQTATGFRALIGWTYSEVTFKTIEGVDLFEMEDIKDEKIEHILNERFCVKLRNKLVPVNNKANYTL